MSDKIYGRNTVIEALLSDVEIDKVLIQEALRSDEFAKIINLCKQKKISFQFVHKRKLEEITQGASHQGVAAYKAAAKYYELEEVLEKSEVPFLLILDGICDPHNLGSILRTANAAGADGIIIPKNRSASLTDVVSKVSAGAVFHTPVVRVTNIVQTMEKLKKRGIWIAGTDLKSEQYHYQADLKGPLAIVIGSEGEGISRLVREKCDFTVKIPMKGKIESLNASVAAGVLLYEALRQRML